MWQMRAKLFAGRMFTSAGPVAQRLEQRTHNPLVVGSNPTGPTICFLRVTPSPCTFVSVAVPSFVPCHRQNRLDSRLFERLDRRLSCLRADVAVAFEHFAADVSRKRLDRLFAHA